MFCPACEEEVAPSSQLDGICLTCGEELVAPLGNDTHRPSQSQPRTAARREGEAAVASSAENGTAIDPTFLTPFVNQLRGDAFSAAWGVGNNENFDDLAGILPPEALNPQVGSTSRPASRSALANLKRVFLTSQSAELFDAQVHLFEPRSMDGPTGTGRDGYLTLNAVPGEFGPLTTVVTDANADEIDKHMCRRISSRSMAAALVIVSPKTVIGGKLSPRTLSEIATFRQRRMPFVAYVERGDVTFVQKAIVCQRAGEPDYEMPSSGATSGSFCMGVIVGNTVSGAEVWPYVMQDSKKEAQKLGLKVPVVMVRREDGNCLVRWTRRRDEGNGLRYTPCRISVRAKQANFHTCPVCTDSYKPGAVIVRLPSCGHVFHEHCALAWLTKHNTCPYCRKELPTDDDDYERERRRREAQDSNSGNAVESVGGHTFYG